MKCTIFDYQNLKKEDVERIKSLCSVFTINRKTNTLLIEDDKDIGHAFGYIFEVLHKYPGHSTRIVDLNAQQEPEDIPTIISV